MRSNRRDRWRDCRASRSIASRAGLDALAFALSHVGAMLVPSIGGLLDAVDRLGRRNARRFEDGRHNVDDVAELATDTAHIR